MMTYRRDTILIVDDERFNLNVLKNILDDQYDVMVSMNGTEALKRAVSSPQPDLILLDIIMPGMDGYQVLARLKADKSTAEIPVIFVTSMSEAMDESKGLSLGAVDYITKPFVPVVALARIQTQLRLKWSIERERSLNRNLAQLNDELADKNGQLIDLNKTLKDLASSDGLTGIPNRRRFDEYFELEWKRALRHKTALSLILMDIDFFKPFNDHYGHAAGDECLKKVAQTLVNSRGRAIDLIARYGGEEFVCLLPETETLGLSIVGNQLRDNIAALRYPHDYSKVAPYVTMSLGGACLVPSQEIEPQSLLKRADERLYKAKEYGRNQFVFE
ncbi:MAG: diguanylate cyclase [Magnetococcus sp. DMHC-6]